jgi:hypothetical protein
MKDNLYILVLFTVVFCQSARDDVYYYHLLIEADSLRKGGQYEESLDRLDTYFTSRPLISSRNGRYREPHLAFLFYEKLIEEYDDTTNILLKARDRKLNEFYNTPFNKFLYSDIATINYQLGNHKSNLDLFLYCEKNINDEESLSYCFYGVLESLLHYRKYGIIEQYHGKKSPAGIVSEEDSAIIQLSYAILDLMSRENWDSLSRYISDDGVLLSVAPCPEDQSNTFSKEFVKELDKKSKEEYWGIFKDSDWDWEMTPRQYIDMLQPEKTIALGEIRLGLIKPRGYINCPAELYPNDRHITFYIESYEANGHYVSWYSVRFIYEKLQNKFLLKAVLYNTWET